jgi:hypothetical protein
LAPDHRSALLVSELTSFVDEQLMKTAGREKSKPLGHRAQHPSPWRGRSKQISLDHAGWEARKTPAAGDVFFLDFSLYRTSRDLASINAQESESYHSLCRKA